MDILSAAKKYNMFQSGDKVLVAVSGGPDSVAMLHALHANSADLGISLHVAHLNHGIRGDECNLDQEFVVDLARDFAVPITTKRLDVPKIMNELCCGIEEAARIVRYRFLQETAAELDTQKIAIGHNADDRSESVLLNIIRGSGTKGMGSISPVRENIVRPVIDATRSNILEYIAENCLPYRIDESNMDVSYTRNRVRHQLIPLLERDFNLGIRSALARLADIASAESEFMDSHAALLREEMTKNDALSIELLEKQPLAVQRRILRQHIEATRGNLLDIGLEHIDRVLNALPNDKDFTITLPSGELYAVRSGNSLRITHKEIVTAPKPFEFVLNIPGITPIPGRNIAIKAELLNNAQPRKMGKYDLVIDMAAVEGELRVRSVEPGDRIIPFGMSASKKLQDIFVDKKIARPDRAQAIVVVDREKLVWVVGVVASEATRIKDTAAKAVRLSLTSSSDAQK